MLEIEVELFGQLHHGGERIQRITLDNPATIGDVARILDIDIDKVGIITMNGIQCEENIAVLPGCRLCFFSYLTGG